MPVTKFYVYDDEQIDIVPCPHGASSLVGEMVIKQILKKIYPKLVNATQKRWLLPES